MKNWLISAPAFEWQGGDGMGDLKHHECGSVCF